MTIWQRIREFFQNPDPAPELSIGVAEIHRRDTYDNIFDSIGEMPNLQLESDVSATKKTFLEYMTRLGKCFREAGEIDGELEQRNYAIADIVRTRVLQIQAYLASTFRAEHDSITVEVVSKQKLFDNAQKEYESQTKHAEKLRSKYNKNFKEFSPGLGYLYLFAAVLLIIADLPLAWKLTSDGFRLNAWQTPIMSVGLALSTLYIKIFYDEFVGSSAEESSARYAAEPTADGDEEARKVNRSWWFRAVVKTGILALCISTIVVLGFFRFQIVENDMRVQLQELLKTNPNAIGVYVNSLTTAAFILITVLFPLIGGVCASLGLDRIQNSREGKAIDGKVKAKEDSSRNALEDLEDAKKRLQASGSYLRWCGEDMTAGPTSNSKLTPSRFVEDYTIYFIACYTHGYERGNTKNNLEKDIFTKAEEFRKIRMAQKAAEINGKVTAEDFYENLKTRAKSFS